MSRAMAGDERQSDIWARRLTHVVTLTMRWVSQHWLTLVSVVMALYVGLPLLAPVLFHLGYDGPANVIHTIFHPLCHQLPERSYFMFGPQLTYTRPELLDLVAGEVSLRFVGDAAVGYKVAICERCTAIYGSWLIFGLLFSLVRDRLRPLSLQGFLLLLVPMGIDGFGQLLGLWSSTWLTRSITGMLFSAACVWLAYPYLEEGMAQMNQEAQSIKSSWDQS